VSHYLGLLAAALSRWDEAADLFREAAAMAGQIGALPSLAHARARLADALAARAGPGDLESAEEQRQQARSIAERLGMTVLLARLAPPAGRWRLRRDDADWLLTAGDEHARLRDSRGLHYLRALLAAPGHDIPALDLAADGAGVSPRGAGPAIDERARSACRRRLAALADELDAADRAGDAERGERLEAERQALLAELRRATGLAGRNRDLSPGGRARPGQRHPHPARHAGTDHRDGPGSRGAPAGVDPHRPGLPV
jgi:hypothetical protein